MLNFSTQKILTVSELTGKIKKLLETEYRFVRVSGEISNLKVPFSGHSYFTLKDGSAQLQAVLFKTQKRFVDADLKDGQQVVCFGRITVYEPRGNYQLIVDSVELQGTGNLQLLFEQLKQKLASKGYFDAATKKNIPFFPANIAVITSPTGAAIQDFLKIAKLRSCPLNITIIPVRVQGEEAKHEIVRALHIAEHDLRPDVIVLCRGGGSLEDLWAFNEEIVADAIFGCQIPVVTGIGHEIDFTIADFCGDHRCPTPTGAAEFLIPDAGELRRTVAERERSIRAALMRKIDYLERHLQQLIRLLGTQGAIFSNREYRLQLSMSYFIQAMRDRLQRAQQGVSSQQQKLAGLQPLQAITLQEQRVAHAAARLITRMEKLLDGKANRLGVAATLLHGVSPLATLGRGYAVVRKFADVQGEYSVVAGVDQVRPGDDVNVLLRDGELDCTVNGITPKKDQEIVR